VLEGLSGDGELVHLVWAVGDALRLCCPAGISDAVAKALCRHRARQAQERLASPAWHDNQSHIPTLAAGASALRM
jgi:hypothetical protein